MPNLYSDHQIVHVLESHAQPMRGTASDYDSLIEATRGKKFVLLGEASSRHGGILSDSRRNYPTPHCRRRFRRRRS